MVSVTCNLFGSFKQVQHIRNAYLEPGILPMNHEDSNTTMIVIDFYWVLKLYDTLK